MGSESTYSECETFTDEDTGTLVPPECLDATEEPGHGALLLLPGRSHLHSQSVVTVIGGEEHFEDYGEGSEAELSPETLCNGEHGCRDPIFLTPSADPLAAKLHSILTDEAFEFYCSQCHKQINRLEDLSARLNDLEKNSPSKRLSSKKVASFGSCPLASCSERHLHQSGALTMEALQDPPPDPVEGMEEDIADKHLQHLSSAEPSPALRSGRHASHHRLVVFLEKRVSELEKDTAANGEQHSRLRQENLQLVHRANALEEQLKEQELRACEMVLEETRKQKELLCKMEREKSIEIENLQARLQQLDEENSELRSCMPCLKASIERLEEEKQKLLDEIEELSLRLSEEQENRRKLGDRLSHERHQFQRDKEATQELIEDLRKQLEHLQLFKLEAEQRRGRSSSAGLQEYNSRTRESELEQEVRRLKQDNRSLKEQNDELNGQIINLSIQGAKNLFSTAFSESLAAEISSVSRDELMDAIQKQEEINFRLQDYIDRIIVAIMETNPSILEVK
ncbi:rab11 family-interacting protein 3 isoform X8 [Lagenorhynchus albirostris]|nr:rab11 family-interacting protein 3 isoform X8 [Lagenorhynchus albirostris]